MARVVIIEGQDAGKEFQVKGECVLGRSVSADIMINDPSISRRHALIEHEGNSFTIKDMGSQNGTFVNEEQVVGRHSLHDGCTVRVGRIRFGFYRDPHESTDQLPSISNDDTATLTQFKVAAGLTTPLAGEPSSAREKSLQRYLSVLYDISSAVGTILDVNELVHTILVKLFEAFPQAAVGVVLVRNEKGAFVPRTTHSRSGNKIEDVKLSRTLIKTAVDERQSILSYDVQSDPRFDGSVSLRQSLARSILCVPLVFRNQVVGLIQLESHQAGVPFKEEDLRLLNSIGTEAAAAVQGAILHRQAVNMQLLRRDLEIAQIVQKHFLPTEMPEVQGYDFVAHYESALQVSGDFFDFIPCPNGQWGVVIGDVSGKGVSAGLVMAKLTSELRFAALTYEDPAEVMRRVNSVLCNKTTGMFFATVLFLKLDPATGDCTACNAGHIPVFHRSESGDVQHRFSASGMPMGISADEQYETEHLCMKRGELMFLVTDGVTEAQNRDGENFGFDRLKSVLASGSLNAQGVVKKMTEVVSSFTSGQARKDDIAIIAIERKHSTH